MPYRIDVYIGSDNASRKIYDDYLNRVVTWANGNFPDGYTLIKGQGCYHGTTEDSLLINAISNSDIPLKECIRKLKQDLGQETIMLVRAQVDLELI